jgi:hypothetical protein
MRRWEDGPSRRASRVRCANRQQWWSLASALRTPFQPAPSTEVRARRRRSIGTTRMVIQANQAITRDITPGPRLPHPLPQILADGLVPAEFLLTAADAAHG